jgi:hypothetical protein
MGIVEWIPFAVFTFVAACSLAFIVIGVVACARRAIAWRLLVGVVLNRGIVFVAWLLVVVSKVSGLRLRDRAYLLLLVIPLSVVWNRCMVERDPQPPAAGDSAPQS